MYCPKRNTRYFLYRYGISKKTKEPEWTLYKTFGDQEELFNFVADAVVTNGKKDSHRWECIYFDEINLTMRDGVDKVCYVYKRDERGNVVRDENGWYVNEPVYTHYIYPYHFVDEHGAIVDIRKYRKEICAIVYARKAGLISEVYTRRRSCRGVRPRSHSSSYYHTGSHFYRSTCNAHTEVYEYAGELYVFKPKTKDRWAYRLWWDDFYSSGECGWKTHKHRKQWMHRAERSGKGVWVDKNRSQRSSSGQEEDLFYMGDKKSQDGKLLLPIL